MSTQSAEVLILNDESCFEQFHDSLTRALSLLECRTVEAHNWDELKKALDAGNQQFGLVVVDPTVEGFSSEWLRSWHEQSENNGTEILTIVHDYDKEAAELEELVHAFGSVAKYFSLADIAFVLKQILMRGYQQKRAHPRALNAVSVEYQAPPEGKAMLEQTFDISEGGIFVHSYQPQKAQTELELTLHLPDGGPPVQCLGEVVHQILFALGIDALHPSGMGIHLTSISDEDRKRIAKFVFQQLPRALRDQKK